MMKNSRTHLAGFSILALSVLSACSNSNSLPAGVPADDAGETPTTGNPNTGDPTQEPGGSDVGEPGDSLTSPNATGGDLSGGEDDSPTATETASLVGPFIKDTSRSAGPPSVPTGLTLLLSAEKWNEFTWAPSTDDQSVEAYEIYRDGTLISTIRGDTGYEYDYASWLSTSFMDCNYTRYATCKDTQPVPGASYSYTVVAVDNEGMRSAHSDPAVYTFEQTSTEPVNLDGYVKVFNDDFSAANLDRELWKTSLPWGSETTINGESQYFVNVFGENPPAYNPFVFTGETVQITGIPTPPELAAVTNNKPYLSGVLTTSDHFKMTYGYVEMNAKMAKGQGMLSTFYLFNQDYEKNKPEIDIIEYIGLRADKAYQTYHYYDSNRSRFSNGEKHSSPTMETLTGQDLSAGFHTYSVLWEPELVVWYIDNQEIRRLTGKRVSDEPMNIIAHLVIGSDWIGAPDESSLPAVFEIDYIRAWQKQ